MNPIDQDKVMLRVAAHELNAVMHTVANNDVRYYLNGFCVDMRNETSPALVATDGHILCHVKVLQDDAKRDWLDANAHYIFKPIKVPAKATVAEFYMAGEEFLVAFSNSKDGTFTKVVLDRIDGKFPHWDVIPTQTQSVLDSVLRDAAIVGNEAFDVDERLNAAVRLAKEAQHHDSFNTCYLNLLHKIFTTKKSGNMPASAVVKFESAGASLLAGRWTTDKEADKNITVYLTHIKG